MAKYNVTYSCGHEGSLNLFGKHFNREWRLKNESSKLCPECYQRDLEEKRKKENREAAKENGEKGLPQLNGTDNQIPWAESIRRNMIKVVEEFLTEDSYILKDYDMSIEKAKKTIESIKHRTEASWWINNRNEVPEARPHRTGKFLAEQYKELEKELNAPPEQLIEEAKMEATIFSQNQVSSIVAEISTSKEKVKICFPGYHEDIRKIAKDLNYTRVGNTWERELTYRNGTPEDRAAEAGVRLLGAGFNIRVYDEEIRNKIINEDYEAEQTRWILLRTDGKYKGWFSIRWNPSIENCYEVARKLPGSRWDNPNVVVPPEIFEEVLDFARVYKFKLSDAAKEVVAFEKKIKEEALMLNIQSKTKEKEIIQAIPPQLEELKGVEIDEELRDND